LKFRCGQNQCTVWPQKSKPLPNDEHIVLNRIKPVNEIIFIRQIKVSIEH